jgi:glyoxalase family protein
MAAKSVNQDDPTVYHLFYSDELGRAGSDITFFEYPGAIPGRAGAGMVHRVVWRVGSPEAIDFWERRLEGEGIDTERDGDRLRFADPEGLGHELRRAAAGDEPLSAVHPEIPAEHALQGFDAVRAYSAEPERSRGLLEDVLGATPLGDGAGSCAASAAAGRSLRPAAREPGARAPGPCTTSPGARRSPSTRAGTSA